jgi:hypothetical protein
LGDVSIDGRIILEWILKKWDRMAWIAFIWLIQGQMASSCEHDNEPSGFRKNFLIG